MSGDDRRGFELLDEIERMQPFLPVHRGSSVEVGQIQIDEAVAAEEHCILFDPYRQIGCGVARRQDELDRAVAQVQTGVLGDRAVGILQARTGIKCGSFAAGPAGSIRDEAVEFVYLGSKFVVGPAKLGVTVDIDAAVAEVTVSADVIEVPLGIDDRQAVVGTHGGSVAMDGGGGQGARAGIDNQSGLASRDDAGVDAPGRHITQAGERVAVLR